jgi:hypothetical protein
MTNKKNYPTYALVGVAVAALAVWVGLPIAYLFLLICPVMMFLMMRGMGGNGSQREHDETADQDAATRRDISPLDGSHERIE